MKVKCPHCGTEREIKGTENRVRCPSKGGCGERYYVKDNIVPLEDKKEDKNDIVGTKEIIPTKIEDLSFGADFNRSVIIEGLNDTIRIYKNSYVNREGSRVSKKNSAQGKKVLEWVERYENQLSVPLLVTYHPYFAKVLAAYQELKKLRG